VAPLAPGIVGVWLERPAGLEFEGGQFVHLVRPGDQLSRPYSIAVTPDAELLEFHVAVAEHGAMSRWLHAASQGCPIRVRGPFGECTYDPGEPSRPLLLAGTGTGLAPLLGVIRTAIGAGHRGPIRLYHGARDPRGLYQAGTLLDLRDRAPTFEVIQCVLDCDAPTETGAELRRQSVTDAVLDDVQAVAEWSTYLCGHPAFVRTLKKRLYLAGAALDRIHSDPFVDSSPKPVN
jgi:NAD(P)H-flavin reductase